MNKKSIYDLKLHETEEVKIDIWITRVPGGWLYEYLSSKGDTTFLVFIPYSKEFLEEEKTRAYGNKTT
jgi:hypothetical protein